MTLIEHLEELRYRIVRSLIAIGVCFGISYIFSKKIFDFLSAPLKEALGDKGFIIFTNLPEAFYTYMLLSFYSGLFFAMPFILHEAWCFIAPGLKPEEKKYAAPFIIFGTIFFILGATFAYWIVFPFAFKFLLGFAGEGIKGLPSMRQYLSFSAKLLIAFGIIFELPVLSFFLAKVGIIDYRFLSDKRRYAIVAIFAFAAILTPPDVFTQLMMAGPLLVLYELSILVARLFGKQKVSSEEEAEATAGSSGVGKGPAG